MSLITMACSAALQAASLCSEPPLEQEPAVNYDEVALTNPELAEVHGRDLPQVGLDQMAAAFNATAVPVAILPDVGWVANNQRDMFDNWNSQVAVALIADAANTPRL